MKVSGITGWVIGRGKIHLSSVDRVMRLAKSTAFEINRELSVVESPNKLKKLRKVWDKILKKIMPKCKTSLIYLAPNHDVL